MTMPYHKPVTDEGKLNRALKQDLGRWLKEQREGNDLTLREVAIACDWDYYSYVGAIERGEGTVTPTSTFAYAKVLNIDPKEFSKRLLRAYQPILWDILYGSGNGVYPPLRYE